MRPMDQARIAAELAERGLPPIIAQVLADLGGLRPEPCRECHCGGRGELTMGEASHGRGDDEAGIALRCYCRCHERDPVAIIARAVEEPTPLTDFMSDEEIAEIEADRAALGPLDEEAVR